MNLKFIASIVGAVGVGATFAWAYTADRAEEKIKTLTDQVEDLENRLVEVLQEKKTLEYEVDDKAAELESLKADFEEEASTFEIEKNPGGEFVEIDSGGEIDFVNNEPDDTPTDEELDEQRAHLQRLIKGYIPTSNPDETSSYVEERAVVTSTKFDPPFVIDQEEFSYSEDEGMDYAKITLRYFQKDRVLLDEDEEPIEDVELYVGWKSLNQFGGSSGHPDVVYVRNRRLQTDFEVELETEEELPTHVKFAMPKHEFETRKRAGKIRFDQEEEM